MRCLKLHLNNVNYNHFYICRHQGLFFLCMKGRSMNKIRNLINITDLTTEEIDHLIEVADDIVANPAKYQDICNHL